MVYYKKVLLEEEEEEGGDRRDRGDKEKGGEGEEQGKSGMGNEDLTTEAAYNVRSMCYLLGDVQGAKAVADRWLVLG